MKQPKYQLKAETDLLIFRFNSEGPKGIIPKLIEFRETNLNDFFNLSFGDVDKETGKLDDKVITNNMIQKRCWQQSFRPFMRSLTNILMLGFMRPVAHPQEQECTEWGLLNILR